MAKVYWITGLSGAGKTTIGKVLYKRIKEKTPTVVLLDGDELREAFGGDLGYTEEDRKKCASRYSRICQMLANQDITVIICTISMYHSIREWNRENINGYYEVYVKVPWEILCERNQKNLYSEAIDGKSENVVGFKGIFEEPINPDYVVENDGKTSPEEIVNLIIKEMQNE